MKNPTQNCKNIVSENTLKHSPSAAVQENLIQCYILLVVASGHKSLCLELKPYDGISVRVAKGNSA